VVFGFSGFRGSCFRLRKFEKLDWLVVMGLRIWVYFYHWGLNDVEILTFLNSCGYSDNARR